MIRNCHVSAVMMLSLSAVISIPASLQADWPTFRGPIVLPYRRKRTCFQSGPKLVRLLSGKQPALVADTPAWR